MTQIRDSLEGFNPWWKKEFTVSFKQRAIYTKIQKFLPLPMMIALTGLRRVGKTTLLQKIVQDKILEGFDPLNILYFSFDEFKHVSIREVLKAYEDSTRRVLSDGTFLVLFDEVQKVADWESQLKTIYDTNKGKIKFIISGSESLFIRKKSRESLAGRLFEFEVQTLSFEEFLSFKGKEAMIKNMLLYGRELRALLQEFSICFGFPELIDVQDKGIIEKYVNETILDQVVYKDIPGMLPIQHPDILASLLRIIRENPGACVEVQGLAQEMGISRQSASTYLSYLEKSFLIKKLYNYSKNTRKIERKLKKYYPAIPSTRLTFSEDVLSRSKLFEWLLVKESRGDFFWRDQYKNEVDIILVKDNVPPIPIEIKYGKIDVRGVDFFMKKFGVKKGYIVSSERSDSLTIPAGELRVIPAHVFLLETLKEL